MMHQGRRGPSESRQRVARLRRRQGDHRHISFDIQKGEIRAIIGPNGAGKTSMLNVINGFYFPQEGTITWQGKVRRKMRPYQAASQGIARTFQNVALFKGMTTLDNIMSGRITSEAPQLLLAAPVGAVRRRRKRSNTARRSRTSSTSSRSRHIRKTPVGRLPYGLQKRVELGRALAMEPELLLLDEPMAGMNLEEKRT
jgi:branched-chain amino acid transport system ATP-binding protein